MYIEAEMWLVGACINMTDGPGVYIFSSTLLREGLWFVARWMVSWFANVGKRLDYV
jgi:hypothetical protein